MKKKWILHSETAYLLALLLLSVAVAMTTAADFGVSMIVAPALVLFRALSPILPWFTFGQAEYVVQGLLFVLFCLMTKRFRPIWLASFATGVIYGFFLDGWRLIIPLFNESLTPPGSMALWLRVLMFLLGQQMTALAIAIMFRIYLYPQVYDFFVKGLSAHFHWNRIKCKRIYDASMFALSLLMSIALFPAEFFSWQPVGMNWGTVVMTVTNGIVIGWWDRFLGWAFEMRDFFPKAARWFSLEDRT